jgi:hypothetical protein
LIRELLFCQGKNPHILLRIWHIFLAPLIGSISQNGDDWALDCSCGWLLNTCHQANKAALKSCLRSFTAAYALSLGVSETEDFSSLDRRRFQPILCGGRSGSFGLEM